jgi:hypothetical protein
MMWSRKIPAKGGNDPRLRLPRGKRALVVPALWLLSVKRIGHQQIRWYLQLIGT